jgi:3-phosphoshikimate 1-carboxyvinyltransferase
MTIERDNAPRAVRPVTHLDAVLTAPPSKSATQRALIAASLARGVSRLVRPLLADDGACLVTALRSVGLGVTLSGSGPSTVVEVDATREVAPPGSPLQVGNAGTAMRFLTARLAGERAEYVVDGDARMRQRPIEPLVAALRALGAAAASIEGNGCPPVRVGGRGLPGGQARLPGDVSSQFLSALLLAGPMAEAGVDIEVDGPMVSRPYVDLTIDMMGRFGVTVGASAPPGVGESPGAGESPGTGEFAAAVARFRVAAGQAYRAGEVVIEGDWSSASYLFAAAALVPGRVEVWGLENASLQGDARFLDCLGEMGCRVKSRSDAIVVEGPERLRGIDADLRGMPDVAPTLAAVALFASGETRILGVPHLRFKESDRIAALCASIARLGGEAEPAPDGLLVRPRPLRGVAIDPHGDHRMAMAFAVVGLRLPGVVIMDPGCVSKSYPGFWDDLDQVSASSS